MKLNGFTSPWAGRSASKVSRLGGSVHVPHPIHFRFAQMDRRSRVGRGDFS
jgi:hypothetical protein